MEKGEGKSVPCALASIFANSLLFSNTSLLSFSSSFVRMRFSRRRKEMEVAPTPSPPDSDATTRRGAQRQPRNRPWLLLPAAQGPAGLLAASLGVEASVAVARSTSRNPLSAPPSAARYGEGQLPAPA